MIVIMVFIENELYWPTVTHYIEAKNLKEHKYEEDIRKTKTVLQVLHKTKEREIKFLNQIIPQDNSDPTWIKLKIIILIIQKFMV